MIQPDCTVGDQRRPVSLDGLRATSTRPARLEHDRPAADLHLVAAVPVARVEYLTPTPYIDGR
jgi:hypothetical protein